MSEAAQFTDAFEGIREHLDKLKPEAVEAIGARMAELEQAAIHRRDVAFEELRGTLTKNRIGFYALGMGIGAVTGYFLAKRLLETKYQKISDEAIEEMREHYAQKAIALESEAAKRPVEEIVAERGYASPHTKPPMAVSPPQKVVDDAEEAKDTPKDERPDPSSVVKEAEVRNVWEEHGEQTPWVHAEELKKRSPDIPYVIHYDERDEMEDYQVVSLTYYEGDDVVCNERDEVIGLEDRERLLGEKNLERFGHGSNDPNVVYVRNDKLELVYEIVKSPNSFAEEVHGFSHSSFERGNLERMRTREKEQISDDD